MGYCAMTRLELTVAILEAGYETAMSKRAFCIAIGNVLRQGSFKRTGSGGQLPHERMAKRSFQQLARIS